VLENGRQIRGRMNQLSVNGGLISLDYPLDEGIRVTVLVSPRLHQYSLLCAQLLFPMWATQGCLQPFRFQDLPDAKPHQPEPGIAIDGPTPARPGRGTSRVNGNSPLVARIRHR
jgi:hypothetical protein